MLPFGVVCLLLMMGIVTANPVSSSASSLSAANSNGGIYGGTYTHTSHDTPGNQYGAGFSYSPYGGGFGGGYGGGGEYRADNTPLQQQQQQPYNPFGQFPSFGGAAGFGNFGFPNAASLFPPFPPLQFTPLPPIITPTQFNDALNQYVSTVQKQYASNMNGGTFAYSSPGASAYAYSSLGPYNLYDQQQQIWDTWRNTAANLQAPFMQPNFAAATGSYGPNGVHQTVTLNPENPNTPNIEVHDRFDGSQNGAAGTSGTGAPPGVAGVGVAGLAGAGVDGSGGAGGAGGPNGGPNGVPNSGYVGISTSSFSTSSNVNGVEMQHKGGVTTINDNGKITTYKLES